MTTSRPRLKTRGLLREALQTAVFIVAMVALVNLSTARAVVDGPSMEPTLYTSQFLLISRLHYLFGDVQHGDIAVFFPPGEDERLIKRVIGVPGDTIEIRDRLVYRNGDLLEEPYFVNTPCTSRCSDETWVLAANEYFFMGDNRNRSRDSRVFDQVPKENIIGRAVLRYLPPQDISLFSNRVNATVE
ncbi:MAG: signal peptidase I [Chloroflexota bacterium]